MSRAFFEVLRYWLEKKGVKQAELARLAGIGTGRMSEYATGRTGPSYDNIQKIAEALGLSMAEFFLMGEAAADPLGLVEEVKAQNRTIRQLLAENGELRAQVEALKQVSAAQDAETEMPDAALGA